MHISRYVLVDEDDMEGDKEYSDYREIEKLAIERGCAIIERIYVYEDSNLIFTPDGEFSWPPKERVTVGPE